MRNKIDRNAGWRQMLRSNGSSARHTGTIETKFEFDSMLPIDRTQSDILESSTLSGYSSLKYARVKNVFKECCMLCV
jgi:hypothetical protein